MGRARGMTVLVAWIIVLLLPVGWTAVTTARRLCAEPVEVREHLSSLIATTPAQNGEAAAAWWAQPTQWARQLAAGAVQRLLDIKAHDAVAYPVHVAAADLLKGFGCSPYAVGVQWLKAGAHAETVGQRARVDAGLAAEANRVGVARLTRLLRRYIYPGSDLRAIKTIERLQHHRSGARLP